MENMTRVIAGTAFHTPNRNKMRPLRDCAIAIDAAGTIQSVTTPGDTDHESILARAEANGSLFTLPEDSYLIPGLVDLHIHAPQWPQLGKALDAPLEDWLLKYTFPLEAKFADHAYAFEVYDDLVATLLAHGTTTAVYFGSVDLKANIILAEACLRHGQRAVIGKVAMDDPDTCPDYYRDPSAEDAIAQTRAFIDAVAALQDGQNGKVPLVHAAITPRFVPSCTDDLLHGLGALAAETGARVQTHCAESDWEVEYVRNRLGKTDAEALKDFGLLTDKTILAHSNFVTSSDMTHLAHAGASIAHCPLSNAYFANAVLPVRRALDHGVKVGLGTDISGGFSPSLFDAARYALMASRCACSGTEPSVTAKARGTGEAPLTTTEVFWLATKGGANAASLPVGAFEPGAQFDAIAIQSGGATSGFRRSDTDTMQDIFEKLVLNATAAAISKVWVAGAEVKTRPEQAR
ncbi:guanine deaminase [Tateyamaria sp. ANG-S1]|uniref:guanine deaminase n=1 Tax=Tateyamaria sp. ANG-S1 TaxID=1577905 RepID=UPI00057D7833|nr:guanine deaminase [Tateyamaria sp. ANG-S1]KIC50220.1 chlorohydrolase [Tateyamaria sp. ANG-S1]